MTTDPSRQDKQNKKRPPGVGTVNKFYKEFGPFLTLGFQLAAAVIVFYFIGSWLDHRF
ncbi:MAG: AtpZ/AtpI family protein, partial [Bacteroidota bacterium]